MERYVYQVPDVNCQHCVAAITREVGRIAGVQAVDVNLERKTVTVTAEPSVSEEQLRAGIEEAGYEIAS